MKKIGIVTITELDNFGNRLQNYALQEILKRKNFEVETVRNLIVYGNRKKKLYKITELLKGILRGNFKYRLGMVTKQQRFEDFDKKFLKEYEEITRNEFYSIIRQEYNKFANRVLEEGEDNDNSAVEDTRKED